jgi:multiple antibiotic resistance protein
MWERAFTDAVTFFVVVNPIGEVVPIFIALTRGRPPLEQRQIARRSVLIATIILVGFLVGGQILLQALEIPLPSFQIASGIVLFLFGLKMIFHEEPHHDAPSTGAKQDIAVFPLAMPTIAGPGAMLAAVVLTDNDRFNMVEQVETASVMLCILLLTFVLLSLAGPIHRLLGDAGANVVSRVMGLILSALAVETVVSGIEALSSHLK